jgi:hypothetical protein
VPRSTRRVTSAPLSTAARLEATPDAIDRLIKRLGERAGLAFQVHVHKIS